MYCMENCKYRLYTEWLDTDAIVNIEVRYGKFFFEQSSITEWLDTETIIRMYGIYGKI